MTLGGIKTRCSHCTGEFPPKRLSWVDGIGHLCPGCYYCWKHGAPEVREKRLDTIINNS